MTAGGKIWLLFLGLGSTVALADSAIRVGDVFSDGAKLVKVESLPQGPEGKVHGSNGKDYFDVDVLAHKLALQRTPSSKFILLYSGGDPRGSTERPRNIAERIHVRRVLAELRSETGESVGFEVAEERGTSIITKLEMENGRMAKLHPHVIAGEQLSAVVADAPPGIEVDTNWGTVETSLRPDLSTDDDRANVADFIRAARARQNFGHTALGKYYVETLRGLVRSAPVRSVSLTQAVEGEAAGFSAGSTLATEAVRAAESAR